MTDVPRLDPLPAADWGDDVCVALGPLLPAERANPRDAGNVLGTLVRHPDLTRAYLEFNSHLLLASTLSERVREVAVLRAVHVRRSDYLWDHHVPIAQRAGITLAEIQSVRAGAPEAAVDRVVVRTVDELTESNTLSDSGWSALREHFDDREVLDLIFTIGCYQLLGSAVNALAIQPENLGDH